MCIPIIILLYNHTPDLCYVIYLIILNKYEDKIYYIYIIYILYILSQSLIYISYYSVYSILARPGLCY